MIKKATPPRAQRDQMVAGSVDAPASEAETSAVAEAAAPPPPPPTDVDRVLGGIYIGSLRAIQEHYPLRAQLGITHILSTVNFEVIPEYLVRKGYTVKNIPVRDDGASDIMQFINDANRFIDSCLYPEEPERNPELRDLKRVPHRGHVLVHCHAGVSRSAAFVIAYLMYRYGLSLAAAFHAVKRKRPQVQPNEGFWRQLEMFEKMGGRFVDPDAPEYRQWRLANAVQHDPEAQDFINDSSNYRQIGSLAKTPSDKIMVARCKKCRFELANSTSFIEHVPPSKQTSEAHFIRRTQGSKGRIVNIQDSATTCSHYFLEPIIWMKDELLGKRELSGKFSCPKCALKVGGYDWKGSRCSCGKWVVPALHLQANRVDLFPLQRESLPNIVDFREG